MAVKRAKNELNEWWRKALLGQQLSAHPVYGRKIEVDVEGPVVILKGKVETADQAEEIEREAKALPDVQTVVNHLAVLRHERPYHCQTVIAVFPDEETAQLAYQTVDSQKMHEQGEAEIVKTVKKARDLLGKRARAAGVEEESIKRYVALVQQGKVLIVERLPEDDALLTISTFEGTPAQGIFSLPPEPETITEK